MPRAWSWCATSGLVALLASASADAALLLERRVEIELLAAGGLREEISLRARMDNPDDIAAWSSYAIWLDENRRLTHLHGAVTTPDGQREKVTRKDQDQVELSASGETYSSSFYQVVEFPRLQPGAVLELSYGVDSQPYFPGRQVQLLGDDPIQRLAVTVRGAGLRWKLVGPADGIQVEEVADGIRVRGVDLEPVETTGASAGGSAVWPTLYLAWGGQREWSDVARWYRSLLLELPDGAPAVAATAKSLMAGARTPRDRLAALLAFLRRQVRYVAVEIGVGGYRPSPSPEVLERRWGDCKDKALLLVEMLRAAGIQSYPALVLSSRERQVVADFPSAGQFNHAIVALPADAVEIEPQDPVRDGYLFVDPTQSRGGVGWLHPAVQDQRALVVGESGGTLVRTPVAPLHEMRLLAVELDVSADGRAAGRAQLTLRGSRAVHYLDKLESASPESLAGDILTVVASLLPGYRLTRPRWDGQDDDVPTFAMAVDVESSRLASAQSSLTLRSLMGAPEPREIEGLAHPAATAPSLSVAVWRLGLPDGSCPPESGETGVDNRVGSFRQVVTRAQDGYLQVERATEILMRWIEPQDLPALREISLGERRAAKRRLRFGCR